MTDETADQFGEHENYYLYVDDELVAELTDPEYEEMFWCSWKVTAVSDVAAAIIRDEKLWENVGFVVKEESGRSIYPPTFSGGFLEFCAGKSDRLGFRSLWPIPTKKPSRFVAMLTGLWQRFDAWLTR